MYEKEPNPNLQTNWIHEKKLGTRWQVICILSPAGSSNFICSLVKGFPRSPNHHNLPELTTQGCNPAGKMLRWYLWIQYVFCLWFPKSYFILSSMTRSCFETSSLGVISETWEMIQIWIRPFNGEELKHPVTSGSKKHHHKALAVTPWLTTVEMFLGYTSKKNYSPGWPNQSRWSLGICSMDLFFPESRSWEMSIWKFLFGQKLVPIW